MPRTPGAAEWSDFERGVWLGTKQHIRKLMLPSGCPGPTAQLRAAEGRHCKAAGMTDHLQMNPVISPVTQNHGKLACGGRSQYCQTFGNGDDATPFELLV